MKIIWTLILLSFWFGSSPAEARRTTCRPGRCGGSGGGGTTELTPEQRRMAIIIVSIGAGLSLIGGVSFCIWFKCIRKPRNPKVNNQVISVLSEVPSTMYYDPPAYLK